MDANPYSIKQVLSQERRYIIPTYQRDYEWAKDGQWDLLFDDLVSVASRLEDARREAEARGVSVQQVERNVAPHFLGAIVLDQLPSPAGGVDLRAVIDGQQRLTTLQLLLRGLLDVLIEVESPRVRQVRRLIENPSDIVSEDFERHKLWPRRRDRDAWRSAMSDDGGKGNHVYSEARQFFANQFRSIANEGIGATSLDVFVDGLVDLFKIVVIDLEPNDDAQVIFEVLNGRQTPLTAADLVKNLLFLRAEIVDDSELDLLYNRYWAPFDDDWWKQEVGRGHAARRRTDMLLANWLTIVSGEEASAGHLYGEVRRWLDSAGRGVREILEVISSHADSYRAIHGADAVEDERLRISYGRLTNLGITTSVPLLIWLRSVDPANLLPADHRRAVLAIESWVIRRLLTGSNTRGYGRVFVEVLKAAQAAAKQPDPEVANAVVEALAAAPNNRPWPDDDQVLDSFISRRFYNEIGQARIRMLLGAIDEHLRRATGKTERAVFDYDALTIEHVMPRSWQGNWPLAAMAPAERTLAEQARNRVVDRIGNLTLVTGQLNPSLSNAGWSRKRRELMKHSDLRLNAEIVQYEEWGEQEIEQRGRRLAEIACRIWPGPDDLIR